MDYPMMETIEGKITAISHIIYIQPKSLFFEITSQRGKFNILVTDRKHLKNWKDILKHRQWVRLNELKRVKISCNDNKQISLYEATQNSQLVLIEKTTLKTSLPTNLINYEGKVTDDQFGSCGFYELDGSLTLCLSYMKIITSLPVIKKGDTVVIHNVHRMRIRNEIIMFVCARGNLLNRTEHKENESLFPKSAREDSQTFLQVFALNNNCSIGLLLFLYRLCREICQKMSGILPMENVTKKFANVNQPGVLSALVDHLSSFIKIEPKQRSLSREFLEHDDGCSPSNKEYYWNVELWPLDSVEIETRCDQQNLWMPKKNADGGQSDEKKNTTHYWDHDVAFIDSRSDRICLLMGVLSFLNGRWELRDRSGSLECIAVDRDCQQFRDRCVFTSKFAVHRESFTVGDSTQRKVYISIDEFHGASLPLSQPDVDPVVDDAGEGRRGVVRFLALNKSMPQMVYSNTTTIRHLFGYLIVASLHGQSSELDRPAKKAKTHHRRSDIDEETGCPANCILLVSHSHPTLSYPTLVEGRVYEIRIARKDLFSNPIYLSALKEIPEYALKNHVYIVPDDASIYPVSYHLPKSESYMRRDVLTAEECLSQEEIGQTVSLRGRIVDRLHMEPRFASEKAGQNHAIHHGTWLGIPGNKKMVLKMGDDRDSSFGSKIDVYFNLREGQVYPLGLDVGSQVELTWLCLRKTQKTARLYCTSTLLTCIRLVKLGRNFGPCRPRIEMMRDACIGRRYISQLETIRPKDVFSCLVTVRYIHKLSISCVCSGCGSGITRGTCTYVGCHWNQPGCKVDLKAWCTVEDGTGEALLFLSGDCCRAWLKLPANVWKLLEENILPHEGEFLYFSSKSRQPAVSVAGQVLSFYCDTSVHLKRPLHIIVDKLVNNEAGQAGAYFMKNSRRLFCLHVAEMDATACANELADA